MKVKNFFWSILFAGFFLILLIPVTRDQFLGFSAMHPYMGGFVKFFILATFGEVVGLKIITEKWSLPRGVLYRAIVWGALGMLITMSLPLFAGGVVAAQKNHYLPGVGIPVFTAFLTSLVMNGTFGPAFMSLHRMTDTYIDMRLDGEEGVTINSVVKKVNWSEFISFVVLKTIPFFWVPAHTIVFIVPSEYRVLLAAFLSVALGGILAFAKKK